MRLATISQLGCALLATLGCASAFSDLSGKQDALEEAQRKYTELVRWGEINDASVYVDPAIADDYLEAAKLFDNIRFTDFESGALEFGADSETATVNVVYHAYSTKTLVEKTFRERQEWYREANANQEWRVRPNLAAMARELGGGSR